MNKKKKIILISSTAVVALLLIGLLIFFLFFYQSREVIAKTEHTYEAEYQSYCTYEHDPDIQIDGVLDESVWEGKSWFSNTYLANVQDNMPRIKVTGFTTDRGIYIASIAEDSNLVNDGQRSPKRNSNWEFYITADNVGEEKVGDGLYRYQFNIDMRGDAYTFYTNFDRAVVVDGELNSGNTKSATLEMFIPWETVDIDTSKGVPDTFRIMPLYRAVFEGQTETAWMSLAQSNHLGTKDFYLFGKDGYTNIDRENAVLGDTKFGFAKTANWDVSKEAEGIVQSSTGTEHHKIFFAQEYGSNFIVETTIIPVKSLENDYPKAGINFLGIDGLYHTVWLDMRNLVDSVNGTKNFSKYQIVTLNNLQGVWNQKSLSQYDSDNVQATQKEGVKLTVIKYGGKFWYFVDDKFITAEENTFMDMDVIPGFYSLGADAIYKDYSCEALSSTDELKEYLNERDLCLIDAQVASAGGSVSASDITVKQGESYSITITSQSGYEVSSILVNGEERITDAKENAVDGTYTITGAQGNQEVRVKFEKCSGNTLSGQVKGTDGAITANITLLGQTNPLLRYDVISSGEQGFLATIPAGTYKVLVTAESHKEFSDTIKVSGDTEKSYTLEATDFPRTVKVNGMDITSSVDVWDLTKEGEGKVSTSYAANGKMAPLYFGKTGTDFVMEATINYTTNFESGKTYQPDLMGGFVFSDGTNRGWIVARDTGIVTSGWKYTTGMLDYAMLTYPTKKTATFSIAKKGDLLYIYFDGEFAAVKEWSEIAPDISSSAELALGLYMIADNTADIEFSNYKMQVGTSAADAYINQHALKDTAIPGSSLFAKVVTVNGVALKSSEKKWDLTNVGSNEVYGSYELGTKASPLFFTKHGSTALIETTIEYTTNFVSGVDYQKDLMGGFVFNDGKNSGWIVANRTGVVYTGWNYELNLVENEYLTYPEKRSVKMTAALDDGYVYIYFDDSLITKKKISRLVPNATADTDLAMGLYMITDKEADIKFSNTSITTDADAVASYIAAHKGYGTSTGDTQPSYNPIVAGFIEYARQLGKGQEVNDAGEVIDTVNVSNNTTVFIGDDFFDRRTYWTDFYTDDYKGKDVFLAGISSTRTDHWAELVDEVFTVFENKSPKNIVIHLGTNDIANGSSMQMVTAGLQSLIEQLHTKYPQANIYYFGITYRYDHTQLHNTIVDTNNVMSQWCAGKDYVTYIKTEDKFTQSMLKDNFHPKLENYSVFVNALKDAGCVIADQ